MSSVLKLKLKRNRTTTSITPEHTSQHKDQPAIGSWLVSVLLLVSPAVRAENSPVASDRLPPTPSSAILRFREDYSYLADPSNRTAWLDPIKYIPFYPGDSKAYLTLGGEIRERFEGNHNPQFGIPGDHNNYWLQRVTVLGDLHLGPHFRFFVEGISGVIEGETLPPSPIQNDPVDLQFAFADLVPYLTGTQQLTLRVGRFGMRFGSGRLVATRASPNIPFKFDGVEMLYRSPDWEATGFVTRPVSENPNHFDSSDEHRAFWGIYLTHWFGSLRKDGVDLYYLGIERDQSVYTSGSGKENRHSFGSRLFGEKSGWDWDGEALVQTGSFATGSILAWAASIDTGYTWGVSWKPRLGLKADVASGDRNPNDGRLETFDALFFKSIYYDAASLVRPENLIDVHPNVTVTPTSTISINGGVDIFWRYSRHDGVYSPPRFVELPAISSASPYLATACDINFEWQIHRYLTFSASYVHFFTGSYVHTAHGGDVDFVAATIDFLF